MSVNQFDSQHYISMCNNRRTTFMWAGLGGNFQGRMRHCSMSVRIRSPSIRCQVGSRRGRRAASPRARCCSAFLPTGMPTPCCPLSSSQPGFLARKERLPCCSRTSQPKLPMAADAPDPQASGSTMSYTSTRNSPKTAQEGPLVISATSIPALKRCVCVFSVHLIIRTFLPKRA